MPYKCVMSPCTRTWTDYFRGAVAAHYADAHNTMLAFSSDEDVRQMVKEIPEDEGSN